jgi:hypothetical protein
MPRADIYLKSGGIITLDVEELTVHKQDGKLLKISWTLEDDSSNRPLFISLDDISAVVEAR